MTGKGKQNKIGNNPTQNKLDERNHVEKSLLNQLVGKVRVTPFLTEPQEAGV